MLIHIMFNIEEIKFQEMNLKNVKGGGQEKYYPKLANGELFKGELLGKKCYKKLTKCIWIFQKLLFC